MKKRLSLDLGSNSIGWVLFAVDEDDWPQEVLGSGVRLFSNSRNAKTNVPLSVERRNARSARRRRDRHLQRKAGLVQLLRKRGYLPREPVQNFSDQDPYLLRHEALRRPLSKYELGRVLLHLIQRRGFLSNRKDLAKEEGGKTFGERIAELQERIESSGAETLGSFLYTECKSCGKPTRMRGERGWYPTRQMYEHEFEKIKQAQRKHHPELSSDDWNAIRARLFFQRPLKKQEPGRCIFNSDKPRTYTALPSFQRFRTLQQLANLKIVLPGQSAKPITKAQRELLIKRLFTKKQLKFADARKLLKLPEESFFNLELGRNSFRSAKYLIGDSTSALLRQKKYFGQGWNSLPEHTMNEVVRQLIEATDDDELSGFLSQLEIEVPAENLNNIKKLTEESFERGYARFCLEVVEGLSQYLFDNFASTYDEAVASLGYHHSDRRLKRLLPELPYYGEVLRFSTKDMPDATVPEEQEFGKIANPTVHVALNQLRKIVNSLLTEFGTIDEVIVEVARDLPLGEQGLRDLARDVRRNESQNDTWAEKLKELGLPNSYSNRLRLRLWEELGEQPLARRCPYSGEVIGLEKLFSAAVEIDHILPKSRTFSNHHSNLVVCTREANKFKGDRSPYEAFSSPDSPFSYEEILARITSLPYGKQRKFSPDALEALGDVDQFLERQLNDTRFISKAASQYLGAVIPRVMASRGRLTAFLRSEMRLLNDVLGVKGKKKRDDHRHHALDAFLVGLSTPRCLKKVHQQLKNKGRELPALVAQFKEQLSGMIVSHRVNHSPCSKFFDETNYGRTADGELRLRRAVDALTPSQVKSIVDEEIREFMEKHTGVSSESAADRVEKEFGAKKVRCIEKDASAVEIHHPSDRKEFSRVVSPMGINKVEAWRLPGDRTGRNLVFTAYADYEVARAPSGSKKPHPAAKKIMTLHKGDYLRIDENGRERTVVVESLKPSNKKILFTDHHVARNENAKGRTISFSGFAAKKVRVVHVDELGRVKDPGAWWINDSSRSRHSNPRE